MMRRKDYVKPTLEIVRFHYNGPLAASSSFTMDFDAETKENGFVDPNDNTFSWGGEVNPDDID